MGGTANATLEGGPLDGTVQVVPRSADGRLPPEVTAYDQPRAADGYALTVITHQWKLDADDGVAARYIYVGVL